MECVASPKDGKQKLSGESRGGAAGTGGIPVGGIGGGRRRVRGLHD